MSLISVKNFITPFTKTTHLVTIVLFTVVFALFRMQGGGFTLKSNDRARVEKEPVLDAARSETHEVAEETEDEPLIPPPPRPGSGRQGNERSGSPARANVDPMPDSGTITIGDEDKDLLGQMMGKPAPQADPQRAKPEAKKPDRAGNSGSLDDIERSLGIR